MRFKKGTKVEVLSEEEGPSGYWWVGEIISGNGHYYNVKYNQSPSGVNAHLVRVPRKAIRPCPPIFQGPACWVTGDFVEAFENSSWKLAKVSNVVGRNYYFVRLLGTSRALEVHESDLRVRQSWENNRWVVIRMDVRNSDEGQLLRDGCQGSQPSGKAQNHVNKTTAQKINWVFSGSKKRGLECYSPPNDTCNAVIKKLKAAEKENRHRQLAALNSDRLQEKVDAVASPKEMLGEIHMHSSLNNRTGLSEMDMERGKTNADVGCSRSLEPTGASVCSSCGSNNPDMLQLYPIASPSLDEDSLSDDAESSFGSVLVSKQPVLMKKDLATEIRKLELYAYRTTMMSLYSSGPLSWEKEALISNLRLELHISNDEHRLELRHLKSPQSDLLSYLDATPQSL